MMAFSVEITDPARDDMDDAVTFIAQKSQPAARKWKTELQVLILSLQEMPGRFAVIPEATVLGTLYRSAPHRSHRIILPFPPHYLTVPTALSFGLMSQKTRSMLFVCIMDHAALYRLMT